MFQVSREIAFLADLQKAVATKPYNAEGHPETDTEAGNAERAWVLSDGDRAKIGHDLPNFQVEPMITFFNRKKKQGQPSGQCRSRPPVCCLLFFVFLERFCFL